MVVRRQIRVSQKTSIGTASCQQAASMPNCQSYLNEAPGYPLTEPKHYKWCRDQRSGEASYTKLPRLVPLMRPRVPLHHDEKRVRRGRDVEYLEEEVPQIEECVDILLKWVRPEQVEISGAENGTVEDLSDE